MKLLGVDYGRRRIGIAATDELGLTIRGVTTIDRISSPRWRDALLETIHDTAPDTLIVGVPLDKDSNETAMSTEARAFGRELGISAGLPVHYVDESYTSHQATEVLSHRKKKDRRDKRNTDRIAACLILEIYQREGGS